MTSFVNIGGNFAGYFRRNSQIIAFVIDIVIEINLKQNETNFDGENVWFNQMPAKIFNAFLIV